MSKKTEWQQQADAFFRDLLSLLAAYENVDYIGQGSYKSTFFRIFADAYRSGFCSPRYRFDIQKGYHVQSKAQRPRICGDTIRDYARRQGWVHAEMPAEEKRYRYLMMVSIWWDEWTYAWDRNPPPRKYVRRATTEHHDD
jgi:hypothetical protein